jgi:hypothetical protein
MSGKAVQAVRSSFASSNMSLTLGNCFPNVSATVSSWVRTASAVGWARIVRIVAAAISAASFTEFHRRDLDWTWEWERDPVFDRYRSPVSQ